MLRTISFCLIAGICGALVLADLYRRRQARRNALNIVPFAAAMVLAARFAGEDGFDVLRLYSIAIFVFFPIIGVASAILLWKKARGAATGFAAAAVLILAVGTDAFFVEPRWLDVAHFEITSSKVKRPIRIAILADIQTDDVGDFERSSVRAAMAENPDIVLLPGDFIQVADPALRAVQHANLRKLFLEEQVTAPLGVFAVEGDNDSEDWLDIFTGLPVLASRSTFETGSEHLRIVGLSLRDSRRTGSHFAATKEFQIVFGHAPDFSLGDVQADLLVAGHTHGGQVQIPGFGPPITLSAVPRLWAAGGAFDIGGGRTLVVSRGVGMERANAPRLRFFCRPQVVIVDVRPAR